MLLYGPTGSGKSTLGAELIKTLFKEDKRRALVFMADEGSRQPYAILEKLGVCTLVRPEGNPWIWVDRAFQGLVKVKGGWVKAVTYIEDLGLIIHEGLTAYAESLMQEMARMSAENINVGGEGVATLGKDKEKDEKNVLKAWKFEVKGDDKEVLRIGGNSMAHYGIAQVQIREGFGKVRPAVPHLYTATLRRGQEEGTKAPVCGPQIVGGALTGMLPRWLDYTFQAESEGESHVLYLMPHPDSVAGGRTMAMANSRLPLEGGSVKVPMSVKPASLVKALQVIAARKEAAFADVKAELGL